MPTQDEFQGAMEDEIAPVSVPGANVVFGSRNLPPRRDQRIAVDQKALVAQGNGYYRYKNFQMTPVGMEIPEGAGWDEWAEVGQVVLGLETSIQWIVGDWAAYGEREWGEGYATVAVEMGYELETLYVYASVCRQVKTLIRNQGLSFSHHRCVTKFEEDEALQRAWLEYASVMRPTVAEFKQDIGALDLKPVNERYDWMRYAVENKKRLSQIDELKPPALLTPKRIPRHIVEAKDTADRAWKEIDKFIKGRRDQDQEKVDQMIDKVERWLEDFRRANRE